jgi:hypothetical protein
MLGEKHHALLVKRAKEKMARNLAMAERHPLFEEKFLNQAIEAEDELHELGVVDTTTETA